MHLKPADFFERNPALDVPALKNPTSVLVGCCGTKLPSQPTREGHGYANGGDVQSNAMSHMQGSGAVLAASTGAKIDTNGMDGKMNGLTVG
jgi:primary-amine oxidase